MFTLDVGVRAVVFTGGKLLLQRATTKPPAWECIGGDFTMGKTLPSMIERALADKLSLSATATKLLYIVERFFSRESTDVHLLEHYYLCDLADLDAADMTAAGEKPEAALVKPEELADELFSPTCLKEVLVADAAEEFNVSPKLIVDNQLDEKSTAESGVFRA